MIRRLKRAAKLNRRTRRYRWPWGTGVWRIVDRPGWSFISEEFADAMRAGVVTHNVLTPRVSEIFPGCRIEPVGEMTVTTWFEAPADPDDPMQWPTITAKP